MEEVLNSERFKNLIKRRWRFSYSMLAVLFFVYYGYVFTISLNKEFVAQRVGSHATVGIVMFLGVIFSAWLLTIIYVVWANKVYDKEVEEIKKML
ncbi:MAG: DUF485 domain-containing protein [Denitrovibrio sp.]|nr:MAG: DUF485 domain-containing protein [Denitrovibrio sp.]